VEILKLSQLGLEAAARSAASAMRSGGIILYPTDTLYGLGVNAFSDAAVDALYALKGRDTKKPIHAVFADSAMVERYAHIDERARLLIKNFLPGPLTLVLPKKESVEGGIARGMGTVGIRIPKNDFCLALAREFGVPYTATSANKANEPTMASVDDILKNIGAAAKDLALVIDAGELSSAGALPQPSTVVDLSGGEMRILRSGVLSTSEIERALTRS
jgi:L-threonylcarbamoyladenylate synthase